MSIVKVDYGELMSSGELLLDYTQHYTETFPTLNIEKSGTLRIRISACTVNYVNNSQVKQNGTSVSWISKEQNSAYYVITDYEFNVNSGDVITFNQGGNEAMIVIVATLDMEMPTPSYP